MLACDVQERDVCATRDVDTFNLYFTCSHLRVETVTRR